MTKPVLAIVIGSTRPGRVGQPAAEWFHHEATEHGSFDVELVDLAEVDLPLLNEPHHPRLGDYVHDQTKQWSATIGHADAVAFVTPEYNHSFNAALKNAIDYLHNEWKHKPAAIVSYGGVAAGARAATALEIVLTALGMLTTQFAVNIPFVHQFIEDGHIVPNAEMQAGAKVVLDELVSKLAASSALRAAVTP